MSTDTSTLLPSSTTRRPGAVTVIPPEEHSPAKWFERNPILTVALAVAIVVIIVGSIFCWIRKKMKKASIKNVTTETKENESREPRPSQTETTGIVSVPEFMFASEPETRQSFSTTTTRPSNSEDVLGESFIIIDNSPCSTHPRNQARRYHKTKRKSLAMPPGFYVSSRRKSTPSISPDNEPKPPRISFARWSTAGLEIHTSDINPTRTRASSVSSDSKKNSIPNSSGNLMTVPMVLRRVSHTPQHTIYATGPLRPSSSGTGSVQEN